MQFQLNIAAAVDPDLVSSRKVSQQGESSEDGYLLLAVLVLIALLLLSLSIAAPKVATDLQRDKEGEAMHRGMQYARAIRLYYRKFGSYPATVEQLQNTNDIRFLRKRYLDPITGKDDWKLIHMGEATVPPMGMFGQPIQSGMTSATTGVNGNGTANAIGGTDQNSTSSNVGAGSGIGSNSGASGVGSTIGSANTGSPFGSNNSGFGSNSVGSNSGGAAMGSDPNAGSSFGNAGGFSGAGATNTGFSGGSGSPFSGNSGSAFGGQSGMSNGPNGQMGAPGAMGAGGMMGNTNGNGTFGGGGPIVGVSIPVQKASIRIFKKKQKYNQWEFVYDPMQDQGGMNGATGAGMMQGAGGNTIPQTGQDAAGSNSGFGSGFGGNNGSGFGNNGFGGNNGSGFGGNNGFGNNGSGFGSNNGSGFGNNGGTTPIAPQSPGTPQPQ